MSDEFDLASDFEEQTRAAAIARQRANCTPMPSTGKCYYCEEPLADNRFCSVWCRDEWDRELALKARR